MLKKYVKDIRKAYNSITQNVLNVSVIICTVCGCTVNLKNKGFVCIHLKKLAEEFKDK